MKIKTEDGGYVNVTMPENTVVDLTVDEEDILEIAIGDSSVLPHEQTTGESELPNDTFAEENEMAQTAEEDRSKAVAGVIGEKLCSVTGDKSTNTKKDTVVNASRKEQIVSDKRKGNDKDDASMSARNEDDGDGYTDNQVENDFKPDRDKLDNSLSEMVENDVKNVSSNGKNDEKVVKDEDKMEIETDSGCSGAEVKNVEVDRKESDIDKVKKEMVNSLVQTVPVVVKFASPEEVELQKLSQIEQRNLLLEKSRELDDTNRSLKSLQQNIWKLLKITVSDFDYGEPENIEKVILDFIRVNGDQEEPSSSSATSE